MKPAGNNTYLVIVGLLLIFLCPLIASALTFDELLSHETSTSRPFLRYKYNNIKWIKHIPDETAESYKEEAGSGGQVDVGTIDLDGDGKVETIKVIWGPGVSNHSLVIEVYRGDKKISTLKPKGTQPNFKVEDIDGDGKLEIVLWGAVADPKMSQLISDESSPFEGHSSPHLFKVSIYKLTDARYKLLKEYTSKKKYEPFCEEMPKE